MQFFYSALIGNWRGWFLSGRKAGVPGEKPLEQDENQQQTQPTYAPSGIQPGSHWWRLGVGCEFLRNHHWTLPAPQDLQLFLEQAPVLVLPDTVSRIIFTVCDATKSLPRHPSHWKSRIGNKKLISITVNRCLWWRETIVSSPLTTSLGTSTYKKDRGVCRSF